MLASAVSTLRFLILATALLLSVGSCTMPVDKNGPNFILIMTDDQRADLSTFMPTVQRELVEKGVSFTQAFTTSSLCCPARTSVLRGQHVHNHQVLSNGGPQGGFPKLYETGFEASTIATWLQNAGYRTALMGKYLNAYPYGPVGEDPPNYRAPRRTYVPPGWSEWFGFLDVPGDVQNSPYAMYRYRVNHNSHIRRFGSEPEDYQTDVLSQQATDFIRQQQRSRSPFFLFLAPTAPHVPTVAAPRHQGTLAALRAPRSPAFNESDVTDKPLWLRRLPPLSDSDVVRIDKVYREQAEMLLAVDEMVGAILKTLQATGDLENTYLIFTTDHGLHMGEHRLGTTKRTPYAASAQLPLVIRGPDVPAGKTLEQLALNIDVAPTLAALAGITPPDFVDGRSLAPLWSGTPAAWRQTSLMEFWPRSVLDTYDVNPANNLVVIPQYRSVRSKDYLYTEYRYEDGAFEGELYDLARDPLELDNIYSRADPDLLRALAEHAEQLQTCAGARCRELEETPPQALRTENGAQ